MAIELPEKDLGSAKDLAEAVTGVEKKP